MIKLYLDISEIIHTHEHTKHAKACYSLEIALWRLLSACLELIKDALWEHVPSSNFFQGMSLVQLGKSQIELGDEEYH